MKIRYVGKRKMNIEFDDDFTFANLRRAVINTFGKRYRKNMHLKSGIRRFVNKALLLKIKEDVNE